MIGLGGLIVGVLVWPLLSGLVSPARDAAFSAVQLAWVQDAVMGKVALWEAPLGAPLGAGTTRADWVLVQAFLTLPARIQGWEPDRVWLLATVIGAGLSAGVGAVVSGRLSGWGPHTLVAMLGVSWGPVVAMHAQHPNLSWTGLWLGAGALAAGWPWLGGLAAGLCFHAGLYTGLRALVVVVGVLLCRGTGRAQGLVGLAAGSLFFLPVAWKYQQAAALYGYQVDPGENLRESLDLARIFATGDAPLYQLLGIAGEPVLDPALPGFGLALAGGIGLFLKRKDPVWRPVLVIAGLAFVLALGAELKWRGHPLGIPGPGWVLEKLWEGGLRSPARWLILSHVALAFGASELLSRLSGWKGWVGAGLVLAVFIGETPGIPLIKRSVWPAGVVEALRQAAPGPLLDRPGRDGCGNARYQLALEEKRPLLGGNYARFSTTLQEVSRKLGRWPAPEAIAYLRSLGRAVVVEHPPLKKEVFEGTACELVEGHRICEVRP